ncbi:hypothetical protein G7009_21150 [Pseudomonas capeferrum]|uniref:hypothetical protein n=1 Tax=Pseudomonas capeferrum TaxID=1495066 RepID=UPI0015E417A1|nr:hypothetical protein [Pseudomonas capeferrum]MBA1204228.1 hypothetical protein [Pseudomonas capeferrum]
MKIACLGWGSLIWKPEPLEVVGPWHEDGPHVPVEFCRVADGSELATAICLTTSPLPVYWAVLASADLAEACQTLKAREQIPAHRGDAIGSLIVREDDQGVLGRWAAARELDAVVWTALPPRYANIENRMPSQVDVIEYLGSLTGDALEHAKRYIQRVPPQIRTPYRSAIEQTFGW